MEKALRYLVRAERSEKEVRDYLKKKEFCEDEIDEAVVSLKELGYIDDNRYSEAFFRHGMTKGWGEFRILLELEKKGIPRSVSKNRFEDFKYENGIEDDFQYRQAEDIASKILRTSGFDGEGEIPRKIQGRIARRLESYGYPSSVIVRTLETVRRGGNF